MMKMNKKLRVVLEVLFVPSFVSKYGLIITNPVGTCVWFLITVFSMILVERGFSEGIL